MNFDHIVNEWSYRLPNGIPNMKNPLHMIELQSLLYEMKYSKKFIEGLLEKLRTYVDNPQNRKLKRVGDPWGSEGDEDDDTTGDNGEDDSSRGHVKLDSKQEETLKKD